MPVLSHSWGAVSVTIAYRRIVKRRLLELRYKSVPLGAMLKVGINQSSQTALSSASIRERLYPR